MSLCAIHNLLEPCFECERQSQEHGSNESKIALLIDAILRWQGLGRDDHTLCKAAVAALPELRAPHPSPTDDQCIAVAFKFLRELADTSQLLPSVRTGRELVIKETIEILKSQRDEARAAALKKRKRK